MRSDHRLRLRNWLSACVKPKAKAARVHSRRGGEAAQHPRPAICTQQTWQSRSFVRDRRDSKLNDVAIDHWHTLDAHAMHNYHHPIITIQTVHRMPLRFPHARRTHVCSSSSESLPSPSSLCSPDKVPSCLDTYLRRKHRARFPHLQTLRPPAQERVCAQRPRMVKNSRRTQAATSSRASHLPIASAVPESS
jgi:hypothetical protein